MTDVLNGLLTLWRSVLGQNRVNAVSKKVETYKAWFPHLEEVYLFYLPEAEDFAELVRLL